MFYINYILLLPGEVKGVLYIYIHTMFQKYKEMFEQMCSKTQITSNFLKKY